MSKRKNYKLKDLASIFHGHPFRSAIKEDASGDLLVVQARDVRKNFYIDTTQLRRILKEDKNNFLIQENDVIFSIRAFLQASVISSSEKIIASASVCIIRPDISLIEPEYLALYLNSSKGQAALRRYSTGTAIKTILMRDLREIMIPVPSFDDQRLIVRTHKNINRQKELMDRKYVLHQRLLESIV